MAHPGHSIIHQAKTTLLRLTPAQIAEFQLHRRTMMHFAERFNMVYFGYVDQRDDEHRLIRGLTVSPTHRDNHYCIGTYDTYDIMTTERHDTLVASDNTHHTHRWIIMQFDLKISIDLPHIFIGLHSHSQAFYNTLFTKFATLMRLRLGVLGAYDGAFLHRYAIYAPQAAALDVERLLDPATTKIIAKHFGTLTAEIYDGCLYVYAEHRHLTLTLLETMLQNGLWLAKHIDKQAYSIQNSPPESSGEIV